MQDNAISIEALLRSLIGVTIAAKEEYLILRGTGAGGRWVSSMPIAPWHQRPSQTMFCFGRCGQDAETTSRVGGPVGPVWVAHPGVMEDLSTMGVASTNTTLLKDLQGRAWKP